MSRTTLILLVVLVLAVVGGGVYFWLNQDKVTNLVNPKSENSNTTVVINTNTRTITGVAPLLVEGDKKLEATLTVNEVTVKLTGVTRAKKFELLEAEKGKIFVIVYFHSVTPTEVLKVKNGLQTSSHITSGPTVYDLTGMKIASDIITNDSGYLKFVVAETAKDLQLVVGTGAAVQTVKLP